MEGCSRPHPLVAPREVPYHLEEATVLPVGCVALPGHPRARALCRPPPPRFAHWDFLPSAPSGESRPLRVSSPFPCDSHCPVTPGRHPEGTPSPGERGLSRRPSGTAAFPMEASLSPRGRVPGPRGRLWQAPGSCWREGPSSAWLSLPLHGRHQTWVQAPGPQPPGLPTPPSARESPHFC